MARKKRKIIIPKAYLYIDKDFATESVRGKYGKFQGRKRVSGRGDATAVWRVKKSHPQSGQIFGRTSPILIRGDKRKRAHLRRRL